MSLTKKQLLELEHWLDDKGVSAECRECGQNGYELGSLKAFPQYVAGMGISLDQPTPVVSLVCRNCGALRLFAANLIWPPPEAV